MTTTTLAPGRSLTNQVLTRILADPQVAKHARPGMYVTTDPVDQDHHAALNLTSGDPQAVTDRVTELLQEYVPTGTTTLMKCAGYTTILLHDNLPGYPGI
jgi:hypothetical protein